MSTTHIVILTLIAYKLLLLAIGIWASRRVKTEDDYFLAGQGLGAWTAGLSYAASTSSAWVLLGFTGAVYSQGILALWLIPGIFGGYILTWLIMGSRLNEDTRKFGHMTIVDFITEGMPSNWKRWTGIICALMILFCFIFYISSQFQAAGNAFTAIFDMSSTKAICLGAFVIVIYCALGGFWAASLTDAIQAFIMLLACLIVPLTAIIAAGGLGNIFETLHQTQNQEFFRLTGKETGWLGTGLAMGLLGTGLGAGGQPQLLNRIMATKSPAARRRAAFITISWGLLIFTGLTLLAFSARALSLNVKGEALFFKIADLYLPPVLAGIVIAAVLSAVMSTVDSLLLASASAVSHDMGFQHKTPAQALHIGRLAMILIAVLAVLMTLYMPKDIFTRVLFAWVALGAAFGPTILTKCLGWKVRAPFILAAVLVGFFISVIAYNVSGPLADFIEKWASWGVGLMMLYWGQETV